MDLGQVQCFTQYKMIKRLKKKLAKHRKSLPLFLFIGAVKTFAAIFFNWVFIDQLMFDALIGAGIAYSIVFVATYIAYVKSKTIHSGFMKYTLVVVAFNLLSVALVTVLVDHVHLTGFVSSSITTAMLVLLRYLILHKFGIINVDLKDDLNNETIK